MTLRQQRFTRHQSDSLPHGGALAGQSRLFNTETCGLNDPCVGRHAITSIEDDDVAWHEVRRIKDHFVGFAPHPRLRARLTPQRIKSAPCLPFCGETHERIQHQHNQNRRRFDRVTRGPRHHRGETKQPDNETPKLIQQDAPRRAPADTLQDVRAMADTPLRCLFISQTAPQINAQSPQHVRRFNGVG